jgi:DNA-binding transcriptional LysR family regulator
MNPSERLKGIDVFVATVAAGSFTGAGEKLSLTPSAVGKAIVRLEQRLNKRLFNRTTRHLALTDAGAAFHAICVRVLEELEAAEMVMTAQAFEPSGRLRIDLPATFGQRMVMPLLLQFADAHPAVSPQVSFTDRFVDVIDEGIDVAVRIGGPDTWPANLGHRYLGKERLIFCAAPNYLALRGTPESPEELAGHDAVMYGRADGSQGAWQIAAGDGRPVERLAVDARMVFGNAEAQLAAVVGGCGIAQMATWLVGEALRDQWLVPILPEWSVDGQPLSLVWPVSRQILPKVDALVALLGKKLRIR